MKKCFIYLIIYCLSSSLTYAQVGINSDSSAPDSSAGLDVKFTDKGFLPPRMSTLQRDQIPNPATGLMIFNTDCNDYQYYKGTGWVSMGNFGQISQPASISGNPSPCVFATGMVYSTPPIPNANSYNWDVPAGATITTGQGTNYISVDFGTLGGSICVTAHNECYNSFPLCIPINLISLVNAGISISASEATVCQGTQVTFASSVTNPGFAPKYQWKKNNLDIPGATNTSYSYIPQHNDKISCRLISNETCVSSPAVYSNYINMTVLPYMEAAITITNTADVFCEGIMATISSVITSGLPEPQYQWRVNSANVPGATNNTYSFFPQEGDSISCLLTSDGLCVTGSPATSNTLIVNITQPQPVSVVIIASENPVNVGTSVTFTATVTNAGTSPIFQWRVNGVNIGNNSQTYSYTPQDSDSISCTVTSSLYCVSGNPALSNNIVMNVIPGVSCPGTPTVNYEGKTYHTVQIGDQCWLRENLNVGILLNGIHNQTNNVTIEKYCYNNEESNCAIYGGLYQWNEMMNYSTTQGTQGICPVGWHIPTDNEWTLLTSFLGGENIAGGKLKLSGTVYWNMPNTGATNISGFTALPAGTRHYESGFYNINTWGTFWTSTESSGSSFVRNVYHNYEHVYKTNYMKENGFSVRCIKNCDSPVSPTQGSHTPTQSQIIWSWNTVPGATGYKWNTTNDLNTAFDLGSATLKTETGLACDSHYTRYVWAYNGCGNSEVLTLTQSTLPCVFECGDPITINHVAGDVAPVTKTATYGTVTNIPGEPTKCWITSNLGSDHQATAVDDATEASSGWYWQFNHKQGYKHDGTTRTPNSAWVTGISGPAAWETINDPCFILLGNGWRIPTASEWTNAKSGGSWIIATDPWYSELKLHFAGALDNITSGLSSRGSTGEYWSNQSMVHLEMGVWCTVESNENEYGWSVRCIHD